MKIAILIPLLAISLSSSEFHHRGAKTALIQYEVSVKKAQKEYDAKITIAQGQLATKLELALRDATRNGDLDEALKIREAANAIGSNERNPAALIIEAMVDHDTDLIIHPTYVFWHHGDNGTKPSRIIVNGKSWHPKWDGTGRSSSNRFPINLDQTKEFDCVVSLADVSWENGKLRAGALSRAQFLPGSVGIRANPDRQTIEFLIRDRQPGATKYRFQLIPRK